MGFAWHVSIPAKLLVPLKVTARLIATMEERQREMAEFPEKAKLTSLIREKATNYTGQQLKKLAFLLK